MINNFFEPQRVDGYFGDDETTFRASNMYKLVAKTEVSLVVFFDDVHSDFFCIKTFLWVHIINSHILKKSVKRNFFMSKKQRFFLRKKF